MSDNEVERDALNAAESLQDLLGPRKRVVRKVKTPAERAIRALTTLRKELNNTQDFAIDVIGNMTSFDLIEVRDVTVKDFLRESSDNVVFVRSSNAFIVDRNDINFQVFYECKEANGFLNQTLENTIGPKLTHLKKIGMHGGFISMSELKNNLISSNNVFVLREVKKIDSVVTEEVINGGDLVSAEHCNPKNDIVYEISFSLKLT